MREKDHVSWDTWLEYHEAQPEVFQDICLKSDQLWRKGFRHYGMSGIIAAVRWHLDFTYGPDGDEVYKINQNYAAYYARFWTWAVARPEQKKFFQFRAGERVDIPIPIAVNRALRNEREKNGMPCIALPAAEWRAEYPGRIYAGMVSA